MASITIRNLDDGFKRRLRVRAAENGRSMEEEAGEILRCTVGEAPPPKDLGRAIQARFAALGGGRARASGARPEFMLTGGAGTAHRYRDIEITFDIRKFGRSR